MSDNSTRVAGSKILKFERKIVDMPRDRSVRNGRRPPALTPFDQTSMLKESGPKIIQFKPPEQTPHAVPEKSLKTTAKLLGKGIPFLGGAVIGLSFEAEKLTSSNRYTNARGIYRAAFDFNIIGLVETPSAIIGITSDLLAEQVVPDTARAAAVLNKLQKRTEAAAEFAQKTSIIAANMASKLDKLRGAIGLAEGIAEKISPDTARKLDKLRDALALVEELARKVSPKAANAAKQLNQLRSAIVRTERLAGDLYTTTTGAAGQLGIWRDSVENFMHPLVKTLDELRDDRTIGSVFTIHETNENNKAAQKEMHEEIQRRAEKNVYRFISQAKRINNSDIIKLDFMMESIGHDIIKPGDTWMPEISVIQRLMKKTGNYDGHVTGILDKETLSALSKLFNKNVTRVNASTFKGMKSMLSAYADNLIKKAKTISVLYHIPIPKD